MAGEEPSCACNSRFECNICLDVAKEPVVTACGHLFCWPCLYRWLGTQSLFCECPVCMGEVLRGNIIPIYGRGSKEGNSTTASPDLLPRPQANTRESLRQQLQNAGGNATELESGIMQLIQNQRTIGGLPISAGNEMTSNNATQVVALAAPQQSSSVEELPTSSTAAAIMGEPRPSRRSRRPSESPTIISRRRRPQ